MDFLCLRTGEVGLEGGLEDALEAGLEDALEDGRKDGPSHCSCARGLIGLLIPAATGAGFGGVVVLFGTGARGVSVGWLLVVVNGFGGCGTNVAPELAVVVTADFSD